MGRIADGSPVWILLAFAFTLGMFWGYIEMFRGVFSKVDEGVIGRTESYLITMAGLAASRIFAAGGAGGLVLQAWALRQAGPGQARRRRQDDQLPGPDLLPVRGRRDHLRPRPADRALPGRGAVHDDGGPGA